MQFVLHHIQYNVFIYIEIYPEILKSLTGKLYIYTK